ncbi:MAG: PrgI family protein, partial [Trebonia sp.]
MSERIKLPADVEMEDKVAFGLTARQLAILAATCFGAYVVFDIVHSVAPSVVAAALTTPFVACGALLGFGRRDGLPADRLAMFGLWHLIGPKRQVLAPEGIPAPTTDRLGVLEVPVSHVMHSGLIELDAGGFRMVLTAGATSFALRSDEEQASMVEAFGRFLNSLSDPVQISVRAEPVDLAPRAVVIDQAASGMPHPALGDAARGHARFLRELGSGAGIRRRQILLVLTAPGTDRDAAQAGLARRASEARELLAAA